MPIGAFLSGLMGGLGEQQLVEDERAHQERIANKRYALQFLTDMLGNPNLKPDAKIRAAGMFGNILQDKGGKRGYDPAALVSSFFQGTPATTRTETTQEPTGLPPAAPGFQGLPTFNLPKTHPVTRSVQVPSALNDWYAPGELEAAHMKARYGAQYEAMLNERKGLAQFDLDKLAEIRDELPKDVYNAARFEAITQRSYPRFPVDTLVQVGAPGGGGGIWLPSSQASGRPIYEPPKAPPRPTAEQEHFDRDVQAHMAAHPGLSQDAAKVNVLVNRSRSTERNEKFKDAQIAVMNRTLKDMSPGDRAKFTRVYEANMRAHQKARDLLNPKTGDYIAFVTLNRREPTEADATAAYERMLEENTDMHPQEANALLERVLTPGNAPAVPAYNPSWRAK